MMVAELTDAQVDHRACLRRTEPIGAFGQDTKALSRASYHNAARRARIRTGNGLGTLVLWP